LLFRIKTAPAPFGEVIYGFLSFLSPGNMGGSSSYIYQILENAVMVAAEQ
jgi:hypothetical protein